MPDAIMPDGSPSDGLEAVVRAVLGTLSGDLSVAEAVLLAELEALGQEVARAKSEIAALGVEDLTASHIPAATDELDAVVSHTAAATNAILDSCETLEAMLPRLADPDAATLSGAVTRIYEACSFQDITGQRIAKVVQALQAIERRVTAVTVQRQDAAPPAAARPAAWVPPRPPLTEGQALAQGPQLPAAAASQAEIDRLMASLG